MGSPFSSSWAKLRRGNQHLNALKWQLAPHFGPKTYRVAVYREFIRQGPIMETRFVVGEFPKPPAAAGLIVGDIVSNFRAALDHVAWQLVRYRGVMPARDRERRQVHFPMASKASIFNQEVSRRLPGVPALFTGLIKSYQPYRRGYESKALRLLNRLSNADKHRVIVPTVTGAADFELEFTPNGCAVVDHEVLLSTQCTLKPGLPIAVVVSVDDPGFLGDSEIEADGYFEAHPSLGRGYDVEDSLTFIANTVAKIIDHVEERL